jgi:carboxymethylenebutenolidase
MMDKTRISVATADGTMGVCLVRPAHAPRAGILLYMDALGVRPALEAMAERLAEGGYAVLLPDLYYRHDAGPINVTQAFAPGPEQERMMRYYTSLTPAMVMADTAALFAEPAAGLDGLALGAVGYCMGGAFAMAAAGRFADRVRAAASIHGGGLATGGEDSPDRAFETARARFYLGFAGIDPYLPDEVAGGLVATACAHGADLVAETYPGVHHGFAVADTPVFDAVASERHWRRLDTLFAETLA